MREEKERNQIIFNKWKKGITQFKLAIEYKMTPSNVARIIHFVKTKYGQGNI